jgi:sarcosine/dimethylglycine N-methyltransferase
MDSAKQHEQNSLAPEAVARDYYDSHDADAFYHTIWGGEDIHIGTYERADEDIARASRRTVDAMASRLSRLGPASRLLDLGAGFGGAARLLARTYHCQVSALNLSTVQNRRNRQLNEDQGLAHLVDVIDGSFEEVPFPNQSFDVIWSQDAMLHSGHRQRVLDEIARLLVPRGELVFTDPMAADDCPPGVLQPILDRIHLDSLASPSFYRRELSRRGFGEQSFDDFTPQLVQHYACVLDRTCSHEEKLGDVVSSAFIDRMKSGLQHWIDGGRRGYLVWGIFHFEKQ